ncbi:MAG: hypothetical protein R3C03_21725 [Pirellulaceae bacterium]
MIASALAKLQSSSDLDPFLVTLERQFPSVSIGESAIGTTVPLVLEADDSDSLDLLHEAIRKLPSVLALDVVVVIFDSFQCESGNEKQIPKCS